MNKSTRITTILALMALGGCGKQAEHRHVSFDVSPEGDRIIFTSANDDLYLFDLKTSKVRQLTKTDILERAPSFSPDGKQVVYAAQEKKANGSHILVRSLDSQEARQLTDTADVSDSYPTFSADSKQIAFARAHQYRSYSMGGKIWDQWDIYVMNADGTQLRRITREQYAPYSIITPRFSPDGKVILFAAQKHGDREKARIFEVDVNAGTPPKALNAPDGQTKEHGAWASEPAYSPDGSRIVFISDRHEPYQYDLFIMDRDGKNPKPLGITSISHYNQKPAFARDAKRIQFLAGTESGAGNRPIFSLWQVDIDGKNAKQIADSGLFTDPLSWKPGR
jgi:Tol biopolymer transport system component